MSTFTIGDFAGELGEVVGLLKGIADKLNQCDLGSEIDRTPGRTAICSQPIIVGGICVAPERESFTVADLLETVEGLRDWTDDVRSRLANYDPETALDEGLRPPIEDA